MHFPRNWRSGSALIHDLIVAGASFWLAHYLRLGDLMMDFSGELLTHAILPFIVFSGFVFIAAGLYRGLWRYASMQDLLTLSKAATIIIVIFYLTLFFATRLEGVPRSVPAIHWLLLLAMLGGPRFLYRMAKDRRLGIDFTLAAPHKVPVLLIGANDAAELFIRESRRNAQAPYHVVGLADDDEKRRGQQVHGVRIYGGSDVLTRIVGKLERKGRKPQRVILAESRPSGERVRALLEECDTLGLPLSRIPQTLELQSNTVEKLETKPIQVEDLLRRPQKVQDVSGVKTLVDGKTVLVTGAGGTIGGELIRQLAGFKPKEIILFEQCEYLLYLMERELVDHFPDCQFQAYLGDIRNAARVDEVFKSHTPQIVFHAAALKHVPLAEANPIETITTNALGSFAIAQAAAKYKAEAMVLISTDKAVRPSSVMGSTKRLAETIMQAMATEKGDTRFVAVRFGNVLGSTGSVVPRFQKQLERGGPLTVTHKDMTRYFMTVREAVELVLQSASLGFEAEEKGGLYVLDMGTPVKIDDLARQMIQLAGLSEVDISIEYTGLRPGEKMHEELFYEAEDLTKTSHAGITLSKADKISLPALKKKLTALSNHCEKRANDKALAALEKLVKS
ncbi:MAG: nucleoside-diphosphate sugar epimerase/dehydratase [Rickettsiales bacterium]|nr:nucleoside-diphosphate sugar epimerase/dehydratase [Rickettsiales bacterium]